MTPGNKGMLIGALVGCLAALSNWNGDVAKAASSIIIAAAIGFAVGHFLAKRRR